MKIYVKKLDDVILPQKGSEVAAGYDIVATSDPKVVGVPIVATNEYAAVDYIEYETNLHVAPETLSHHILIHPRSSVSKLNLVLANSIGLVDNDYRGMIKCRFKYVWQPEDYTIVDSKLFGVINYNKIYKKGDKIAQLVMEPTVQATFEFVDELTETQRGTGGFGSSDAPKNKELPKEKYYEEGTLSEKPVDPPSSVLEMYEKAGGIETPKPYSEQIKKQLDS